MHLSLSGRGQEGPENDPVDRFHRRTGRQALCKLGEHPVITLVHNELYENGGRLISQARRKCNVFNAISAPDSFPSKGKPHRVSGVLESRPVACFQREQAGRPWANVP